MKKANKDQLKEHRLRIDELDKEIINLVAKRQREVKEIGRIKKTLELPVYDAKRELQMRTKRRELAKKLEVNPLRLDLVFEQIVLLARESQKGTKKMMDLKAKKVVKIGVMGGIGSFSEAAALQYIKTNKIKSYELYYPISSDNVLKDLGSKTIDIGIFPIENSTGGLVNESIYAASKYEFEILDIFSFDVIHCLLALPGVKEKDIKKVMSHPQALKQCKGYLKKNFPHAEQIEATDTAEGARILEQSPEENELAVIAPKNCAKLYHLDVLEEGIQDLKINYTRFISAKK